MAGGRANRSAAARRKTAANKRGRAMPVADDEQTYGRVLKMLGNNRVRVRLADGEERQCRIRGSMRRREWVNVGDLVLVALRDLAGDQADVVFKYQAAEVQSLRRMGEAVGIAADDDELPVDEAVVFADDDDPEPPPPQQPRWRASRPGPSDQDDGSSSDDSLDVDAV